MKALSLSLATAALLLMGCSKDNSGDRTQLNVELTDAPFNATEVNVDIEEVWVRFDDQDLNDDDEEWTKLQTNAEVYNLLDFQNGVTTPLASGMVPMERLSEMRFVLGSDNSIVINGETYPLTIPSGSSSGLKFKVDQDMDANLETIVVDFDAGLSIKLQGNNEYKLIPVIKVK